MTQWSDPPGRFGGPNPIGDPGSGAAPTGPPAWEAPLAPPDSPPPPPIPSGGIPPAAIPPGGPPWPGYPGPYPSPPFGVGPRKSRTKLVIVLTSAVALLLGAVLIGVNVHRHHNKTSLTAGETVRAYLEALSRGDAAAALSYASDEPASKKFLTDDVLKKQIAHWPITNIRILNDDASSLAGSVHVAVNFGDQVSDHNLHAKKDAKGAWKIDSAAVQVTFLGGVREAAMKTLTIFGEPVDASTTAYVFPGWVDFGSSNPNLTVEEPSRPYLLDQLSYASSPLMSFDISDAGQRALETALKAALQQCARSGDLHPENCPQYIYDSSLVNGTARWTLPSDLSPVRSILHDEDLTVRLRGLVEFGLTATASAGGQKSGQIPVDVFATADLTKNPVVVTFE